MQINDIVTVSFKRSVVDGIGDGGKLFTVKGSYSRFPISDVKIIARHNPVTEDKHHAKSGEWIKIVSKLNRSYPVPFVNGDIFQTDKMSEFIPGMAYVTTTPWMFPDLEVTLVDSFEYVVMEGYRGKTAEVK